MTDMSLDVAQENPSEDPAIEERVEPDEAGSSSSLSEPGDRSADEASNPQTGQDGEEIDDLEESDTEAETERLEKTPRNQRNVLLTPANGVLQQPEGLGEASIPKYGADAIHPASDDSSDEFANAEVPRTSLSPSRKRKRTSYEDTSSLKRSDHAEIDATASTASSPGRSEGSPDEERNEHKLASKEEAEPVERRTRSNRKRELEKSKIDGVVETSIMDTGQRQSDENEDPEIASSNGEDMDLDDVADGDGADAENQIKDKEILMKKKVAMESLSAIENCFATLRDKLFDERLAQCQEEMAILDKTPFVHPELTMMKEVIDRRRDQKVKYEKTLLKFKLESLQRESIAQKAQVQSQYMQTASAIRDESLTQINKAISQTQRERRNCEADVPDYMYEFNPQRSQQIKQQMAYNEEVSILSGVAKYVGFPAAPEIITANAKEFDNDRRVMDQNMAVADQAQSLQNHPPMLRASLSAASTFSRLQSGAEDYFLQQNAWANPQHPAHQMHRQVSMLSRAETPSTTPPNHKRPTDSLLQPQGSASTVAEPQSGPSSSVAPTPATVELAREKQSETAIDSQKLVDTTPSRMPAANAEEVNARPSERNEPTPSLPSGKADQGPVSSSTKAVGVEGSIPAALPKPLPFIQNGGPPRASPPARYPVIKAEDVNHIPRHSPVSAAPFPRSSPVAAGPTGQTNRIVGSA